MPEIIDPNRIPTMSDDELQRLARDLPRSSLEPQSGFLEIHEEIDRRAAAKEHRRVVTRDCLLMTAAVVTATATAATALFSLAC